MKKCFLFAILPLALSACSTANDNESKSDTAAIDTSIIASTQQLCYIYAKDKDTARITMMTSGQITTGELSYSLYEKDKNTGIFEGELRGDTLIAEYTFSSEGKESVRQVAFLKRGDQLVEGYGDIVIKNGKTVFKNPRKLTFGNGIILSKTNCY